MQSTYGFAWCMKEKLRRELERRKVEISANKEKPSSTRTTTRCSQSMIRLAQKYVEKKLIAPQKATLA
jgi:hypothetical protein